MPKLFPDDFAIEFETTGPLVTPLNYYEAFGVETPLTYKGLIGLYCLNRFIKSGDVNRAGMWLLKVKSVSRWKVKMQLYPNN